MSFFFYNKSVEPLGFCGRKKNSQVITHNKNLYISGGWSGGANLPGKLSVPGRPNNLDDSRTRVYCANQPTTASRLIVPIF